MYYFNSVQMRYDGQKSLRDYFMSEKQATLSVPSGRRSPCSPPVSKRTLSDDEASPSTSTPAKKKSSASKDVIVIDSEFDDDEENVFKHSTKYRNSNFFHSPSDRNVFRGGQSRHRLPSSSGRKKTTRSRVGKWSCAVCTYSNHPLISYCEMCSNVRELRPTFTSNESLALEHSNPAVGSSSVVNPSATDNHQEATEMPIHRHNYDDSLSSSVRESWTPSPGLFSESDADEACEIDELSASTTPTSAVSDTSLLKSLDIGSDEPTAANSILHSYEDTYHNAIDETQAASDKVEFSSELNIDFSNTAVHKVFQYSCSRHSCRIYVYDQVLIALSLQLVPRHLTSSFVVVIPRTPKMDHFCHF